MKSIQEIFSEIRQAQKEQKDIKSEYKDALVQADEYEKIVEEIKQLREKKQQIEARVQQQLGQRYEKLEELKSEVDQKKEMLSDIAISTLMEGKTVEVLDEFNNRYDPVYVVKFKKSNEGVTEDKEIKK